MLHLDGKQIPVFLILVLILVLPTAALAQGAGSLEGLVVNGTEGGPEIGAGVAVTLYVLQGGTETDTIETVTSDGGRFRFEGLATDAGLEYWPEVEYLGVPYRTAEPFNLSGDEPEQSATISVFETTDDDSAITLDSVHFIAESFGEMLRLSEIHLYGNSGDRTFVGQPHEDSSLGTVNIPLPENAVGIAFEQEDSAERFVEVGGGIIDTQPVPPGQETSIVFFSYHLPVMGDTIALERTFAYPLARLNMLVAQPGLQLNSDDLEMQGPQSFQGRSYDLYGTDDLPANAPLGMVFVPVAVPDTAPAIDSSAGAMPPAGGQTVAGTSSRGSQEILRWLGFGLVALAVIGLVVYAATKNQQPPAPANAPNLSSDPETRKMLAELADLEDAFEAGRVDETSYERQRSELHEAIKSYQS
jgi:hypothetical protein